MQIHRSEQLRRFTVLPNGLLQDRRLSFTARGLLVDLLSRPDGWREDGRQMADSSPQGRGAVQRALKELAAAGYYRVERVRRADGTIRSEAHVFDTPQLGLPTVGHPVSGEARAGSADVPPVKDQGKKPTLPRESGDPVALAAVLPTSLPAGPDEQTRTAVAVLYRVIRPEPRLSLGEAEARELAPLVAKWLEHGYAERDLADALLPGLPAAMHSPAAVLRSRLVRKLPPPKAHGQPKPSYAECAKCHDPVPDPGICRPCAGLGRVPIKADERATRTARGLAMVRASLQGRRVGTSAVL
ncbi:hypothetical protein E6W39_20415 [Kitasatospora acidiphila]|uniref:Helix-turn-helix domain-containing protein n=1 Tax=Kitasatospora acidiphila TaxID=2567942 RepID=A0A540W554_9ACTN|nr:hypothetical protein [Kitasatospora acidiphila]TQF04161.1 hypothetical protein E6W39_20415 [Kitasatospora acidiphila]